MALKCLPEGWHSAAQHCRFRPSEKSKSLNLAPSNINATVTLLIIALLYCCSVECRITGEVHEAEVYSGVNKLQLQSQYESIYYSWYGMCVPLLFAATLHYFCWLLTCEISTVTNGCLRCGNYALHRLPYHLPWQLSLPASYLCMYNQSLLSLVAIAYEGVATMYEAGVLF